MQRWILCNLRAARSLSVVAVIACATIAQARDLFVSANGSDTAKGTQTSPYRTIAHALSEARPGDTVRIGAGVYVERVVVPQSGAPGKPIVICGQRGDDGQWRTIIDSSAPLQVRWEPAPEIGTGVYKTPRPGFEPRQMLVDGKFIPRIWEDHMADGSGFEALGFRADHVIKNHYNPKPIIPEDDHPRICIYHNSFVGGRSGLSVSGWAGELGGLPETVVVNNVFSTGVAFWAARTFIGGEAMMGVFDHNWLGGGFKTSHPGHDYTSASWYGKHNVLHKGASLWDASKMPDFKLPTDSSVRLTGLNLAQSNELGGRKFGPLPGMKNGSAPHIGAY